MTPSERIKAMLAYLGINAKKFSAHLGYERPQLLYDIINDRTKRITELLATRIVSAYPQFNRVWLITGEGEMLAADDEFNESNNVVLAVLQREYLRIMRPIVEASSDGKEALQSHLATVKRLAKKAKEQTAEELKEFREYKLKKQRK